MRKVIQMRKQLVILFSVLLLFLSACSANTKTPVQYPFYTIKDNEGETRGYLLGTIHLGTKDMEQLPPKVLDAVTHSDVLMAELERNFYLKPQEYTSEINKMLYTKNGETIFEDMSDDQKSLFLETMKTYGYNEEVLSNVSRIGVTQIMLTANDTLLAKYAVDSQFMKVAGVDNLKESPFETVEEQVKIIEEDVSSLSMEEWMASILPKNQMKDEVQKLFNSYTEGQLEQYITNDSHKKELESSYKRNQKWIEKVENELLGSNTIIIVVGAAHFYGEEGLIKLIEQKGYHVIKE